MNAGIRRGPDGRRKNPEDMRQRSLPRKNQTDACLSDWFFYCPPGFALSAGHGAAPAAKAGKQIRNGATESEAPDSR